MKSALDQYERPSTRRGKARFCIGMVAFLSRPNQTTAGTPRQFLFARFGRSTPGDPALGQHDHPVEIGRISFSSEVTKYDASPSEASCGRS
jgi:hypothetical protein